MTRLQSRWPVIALCCVAVVSSGLFNDVFAVSCAPDKIDETVSVAHVYDGDTVRLTDGRRLRFIGIDSPELAHDGEPSQPYAQEARDNLRELLAKHERLGLRFDTEPQDRYRRKLAHLFLPNGASVESWLLERGLAATNIVPPNVWNLNCYLAAERRGQALKRGIWSLPSYQTIMANQLPDQADGFHIIEGRVLNIDKTRNSIWIDLTGNLSLRIEHKDRDYFPTGYLENLKGRRIIARGWIKPRARGPMMQIRHPAALNAIE